jgi:putative transposase
MRKALKRHGSPEAITTDGLRAYTTAMDELGNCEKQHIGRHANNRVENSHLPFRRRERAMLRFRQMRSLQKFVSFHANVRNHFNSNATSSIARPSSNDAPPHWQSGNPS